MARVDLTFEPCPRCGQEYDGWLPNLLHDLRCWGLRTAIVNLWYVSRRQRQRQR